MSGNTDSHEIYSTANGAVALHTHRGPSAVNEDAVMGGSLTLADGSEWLYAAVADQAGGMGKMPGRPGGASDKVLDNFQRALRMLSLWNLRLSEAFETVVEVTGEDLRPSRAGTTFTGAVVRNGRAWIYNIGDSQALWITRAGELQASTELHNHGASMWNQGRQQGRMHQLTRVLGHGEQRNHAYAYWRMAPGDWLVLFTDGIGDANQNLHRPKHGVGGRYHADHTNLELAPIVAATRSPEDAVRAIEAYIDERLASKAAKPDNRAIAVIQIPKPGS